MADSFSHSVPTDRVPFLARRSTLVLVFLAGMIADRVLASLL